MRLILLTHPPALGSVSMPRFADMIMRGMTGRGHQTHVWTSPQKLGLLPVRSAFVRKWLGYVDQFLIYPRALRKLVQQQSEDTLFVLTDQALGMWVPQLAHRPHVIHCHDFLALRSALGEFPENSTGWTGRQYQRLIRNGFSCGKAFISVSRKTKEDLHRFLPDTPELSEVIYNGLNHPFRPMSPPEIEAALCGCRLQIPATGYIVHIGGNQWYKNRPGVLELYRAYVANTPKPAELWMIGASPTEALCSLAATVAAPGIVRFISDLTNEQVNATYSGARALLFPSLEEGFGWPIIEAMASECPVITTNTAPMTEVAGTAAHLIPRMPTIESARDAWAGAAAQVLAEVVSLNPTDRQRIVEQGRLNAARFDTETCIIGYERIYQGVLAKT